MNGFANKIFNKSSENMDDIPDSSIDMIVTSPPYNIDIKYGNKVKNGKVVSSKGKKYKDNLTDEKYMEMLRDVFNECSRVLKDNGSIWVNIKNKNKNGEIIPPFWIIDLLSQFYLKDIIIWNFDWGGSTSKRFAPRYEYVFWFVKNKNDYTFNLNDVKVPALNYRPDRYKSLLKNPSNVWRIPMISGNYKERTAHPAQFPEALIKRIILSGSNPNEIVLDPFMGSGTTAAVAKKLNRKYCGYETVNEYVDICNERLKKAKDGEMLDEI